MTKSRRLRSTEILRWALSPWFLLFCLLYLSRLTASLQPAAVPLQLGTHLGGPEHGCSVPLWNTHTYRQAQTHTHTDMKLSNHFVLGVESSHSFIGGKNTPSHTDFQHTDQTDHLLTCLVRISLFGCFSRLSLFFLFSVDSNG